MSTLATATHLEATQMFIDANPVTVTLYRASRTPDGRGGSTKGISSPVAQSVGRLVGHKPGLQEGARTAPDGLQVSPQYSLILMPDVDIQPGDTFSIDTQDYLVVEVSLSPPWRVSAEVMTQ